VFFNLFFEAEPFATILILLEPHAMIHLLILLHKAIEMPMISGAFTHEFCSHNHKLCSLNTNLYSNELIPDDFGCSLNFSLASGGPAEPLDATLLTLRFHRTVVEKHWYRAYIQYIHF